jgi:hypothetical protein
MIVDNLNIMRISRSPAETDTPLAIDSNAVLSLPFSVQCLKTIVGRYAQFVHICCRVQHPQLPHGNPLDGLGQLA